MNIFKFIVNILLAPSSLLVSLVAVPNLVLAVSVIHNLRTHEEGTLLSIKKASVADRSKAWGLTIESYQHYKWLMQNTPSGHWYRSLDPAEVLALNADNANEMMRYVKIQAKNMHERVQRELLLDRFYRQAYRELYSHEKPIQSRSVEPSDELFTLMPGDRVWLFLRTATPLGHYTAQRLLAAVKKTPNTILDIYFVDKSLNSKDIQQWSMLLDLTSTILKKRLTLNNGQSRFLAVTKRQSVRLPYIGVLRHRYFQPIVLSSLR